MIFEKLTAADQQALEDADMLMPGPLKGVIKFKDLSSAVRLLGWFGDERIEVAFRENFMVVRRVRGRRR